MKRMEGLKRALSLLMCLIMVVGMLPMDAISVTMSEDGTAVYEIGDTVWVRGEEGEPTGESAPDTFWLPVYDEDDQPVTKQGLCEKAEHTHAFVCAEDCQLAHVHDESCYAPAYTGCVIHTHGEDCTTESVYDCGKALHENHDNCTAAAVCKLEVHDHASMNCATEVRFTCTEEHEHSVEAECAHETVYTCGRDNHAHAETGCEMTTVYDCGKEIHTHENCTTSQAYTGCVEHTAHDENCTTEQQLSCGKAEHACTTEGCAADCAIEEHTHTEECDMEGVYYKWTVVEDTSSTLEGENGLPIHFFIAEPGQAIDPNGRYVNYKQSYWGSNNDSSHIGAYSTITSQNIKDKMYPQIATEDGIRNTNNEETVTQYIAKLHNSYLNNMAGFKDFGSLTFSSILGGSTTYYDTEYEIKWVTICYRHTSSGLPCNCNVSYEHIHIDGILSKKIAPAELKLTKRIPADATNQETFNFTLTKLQHNSAGNPTQNVDTTFGTGGSINLTATIRPGQTSASIVSPAGTEIGFGYYMLEEHENDRWQTSGIVIDRTGTSQNMNLKPGPVYIYIAPDGTLRYSSTYNGTYAAADNIYVDNERKPLNVTYSWEGIPEGLTPLPESSSVAPGTNYRINTSYPIGTRVRGTGENAGKYYEFMGWQHYTQGGQRQDIRYNNNGVMDPSTITVNSNTNIHGLWTEHDLPTATGYITITKRFVNKPDASFSNFYIAVLHENYETDITPALVGTWNADKTQWTYNFPISMSGEYTIVEGKYDVAGYNVETAVGVVPVTDISTAGADYTSEKFISDGHEYVEFGKKVNITLPYDESVVSGAAGQADGAVFHAATVNFTNTYTKKTQTATPEYPDLRVRKWDGNFYNTLTGAEYSLTKGETTYTATVVGDTSIYRELQPGTYTLKETKAPEGYIADTTEYKINVVESGDAVETLKTTCTPNDANHTHTTACYTYVTVQNYTIEVPDADGTTLPGVFNPDPEVLRLNIPNEQIKADLNISKAFNEKVSGAFTPVAGTILLDIYGPVVKDDSGTITDVGPLAYTRLPITSDNGWKLTVEGLPYGEYFVEEIMASIHGYTWTGATFSNGNITQVDDHIGVVVDVEDESAINLTITNQYTEWDAADFFVLKENPSGDELGGAHFQLFDGTANVTEQYLDKQYSTYDSETASAVTNSNGMIHFVGFKLADGQTTKTFTLKETQAPTGYYVNNKTYTVTVTLTDGVYDITIEDGNWDHDDDMLTVVDTPILGQITVTKTFAGDAVPDDTAVRFTLTNASGSVNRAATITKKDGLTHTFSNLPLGTYTITEVYASVPGYTYVATYSVNGATGTSTSASVTLTDDSDHELTTGMPDGAKATVAFTNTYTRQELLTVNADSFTVFKRDENGEDLPGAKFALFEDEACTDPLTGVPFDTEAVSDQYGQARFTGLKLEDLENYGDYKDASKRTLEFYMKEIEAPKGYVLNDTVWKIKLGEDIKVEVLNNRNIFETVVDWITGLWKPKDNATEYEWVDLTSLAVVNERIKGTLTVAKTFTGVDVDDIANARVEIHVHGPITRDADNNITDIGPLVETINLIGVNLTSNNTLIDEVNDLEIGEYVLREPFASIHGHTWTRVEYKVDGIPKETVKVNNMDFAVFSVDAETPDVEIVITNTYEEWEAADFYINKVKSLSDLTDGLANAKFQLYNSPECKEGDEVESTVFTTNATTGIAGYAQFSGFSEEGIYYLKEVEAPDNYKPTNTIWKVEITPETVNGVVGYAPTITKYSGDGNEDVDFSWNGDLDVLNVVNEEILGSITITKEFPKDKPTGLESINVRVVGPNGYSKTVTLGKRNEAATEYVWTEPLTGLHMGDYYILEQNAAVEGYTLVTEYFEGINREEDGNNKPAEFAHVTLSAASSTEPSAAVTIKNSYYQNTVVNNPASFTIKKTDENGKTLSGAKFTLSPANMDGVSEFTTDSNGEVVVDGLIGNGTLTGQSSRTYTLTETVAPIGHEIGEVSEWEIEVIEDGGEIKIVLNGKENQTIWDWIIDKINPNRARTVNTLTVVNNRKTVPVSVTKVVSGLPDSSDETFIKNLLDAKYKFELYIDGSNTAAETITVEAGETKTFEKQVPYGSEYEVKEVTSDDDAFTSVLTNGSGTVEADDLNGITVTATNTYTFQSGDALKLDMVKVAADRKKTPLSGAKFGLYDEDGTVLKYYESDKNGKFQIAEIDAPGTYSLKEIAAPSGYEKLDKPVSISAEYVYDVIEVNGAPVIVKSLEATVAGKTVYEISENTFGIKNSIITDIADTGDDTNLMLWGGMTVTSLLCMAMMILFFPKKKGKYQR